MKVINDLLGYKDLKIVQNTNYFSFSLDSVLLPNFVTINKSCTQILDIGTGNAPIPLILSTKTKANITGIEIQKEVFEMAKESLELNKMESRISLINDDVKNLGNYFDSEFFDIILSNPPYFKSGSLSKKNFDPVKAVARHEIKLNLEELIKLSFKFLKNDGILALVYRTDRMVEVLKTMSENRIEPKKILLIFPKKDRNSNLFLVEGVKNAKPGIKELKNMIIHDDEGNYTDEILKYFS